MAKQQELQSQLEGLRNSLPDLNGVLVASHEGLPIVHHLSKGSDPNCLAAMATALCTLGSRVSDALSTGNVSEVSISGESGNLLIYSAGPKAVLAVMGPSELNLGWIHMEATDAAKKIGTVVESRSAALS